MSTAVSSGHFLPQPAVAAQPDFFFRMQWSWPGSQLCCTRLTHREGQHPLSSGARVRPIWLPLSWQRNSAARKQGGFGSESTFPTQVPRAQQLSAASYSQLFLVRYFLMRTESDRRGGRRKLHKQNKSVIKFPLQMSRSALCCYFTSFCHILDCSSRNSLLNESKRAA